MKKLFFVFFLFLIIVSSINILSQDQNMMNKDEMMKAWQAYMTPGPMHQMLSKMEGKWKASITMWMMDPAKPPMNSEASVVIKPILGGRYFQSTYKGKMMDKPFDGVGIDGYDNAKKVFFSTWIDNMGTGIMYTEGTWDDATKTINYSGTMTDVWGKSEKVRTIIKPIDDNNTLMQMYLTPEGKDEYKYLEIMYTKK